MQTNGAKKTFLGISIEMHGLPLACIFDWCSKNFQQMTVFGNKDGFSLTSSGCIFYNGERDIAKGVELI